MSAARSTARSSKTRVALGLAIAGLLAVFSGGLLLVTQGAAVSTTSSADQSVDYTEWVNQGDPVLTHENVPPGPTTDTERWIPVGEPTKHVTVEATEDEVVIPAAWANFSPNDQKATFIGPPKPPVYENGEWNVKTDERGTWNMHASIPGGHEDEPDGVYAQGNPDKGGNWFFKQPEVITPGQEEVAHLDYVWQKQVRTVVTPPVVTPPVVTPPVVEPPEVAPAEAEVPPRCPEPWPWPAEEPTKGPQATEQAAPEVLGEQASAPAQQNQVPTVVDAGYAGQPSGDGWATALLVGGLLLLTSAGAVARARRT